MKKARRGPILHDGWNKNGVHYVAIHAYFTKEVPEYRGGGEVKGLVPELILLAHFPTALLAKGPKDVLSEKDEEKEMTRKHLNSQLKCMKTL